jgi:hypothetical protein
MDLSFWILVSIAIYQGWKHRYAFFYDELFDDETEAKHANGKGISNH